MSASRRRHDLARKRRRAKLRWRCRRGMKELDLLLERFLAQAFDDLNDEQLDLLERLLESPDQDLLGWLSGAAEPGDECLVEFGRWIRGRIVLEPVGSTSLFGRARVPHHVWPAGESRRAPDAEPDASETGGRMPEGLCSREKRPGKL